MVALLHSLFSIFGSSRVVGPRNAKEIGYGAEAGFYLVVLNPRWVTVKAQYTSVVLYPVRNYVGASQHPFEGRVREPRFVFLVAAVNISVVSGEPHLLKGEIVEFVARRAPVWNTPSNAAEIFSV